MSLLNSVNYIPNVRKNVKEFTFGIFEEASMLSQRTNSDEVNDDAKTQSPTDFAKLINSTPFNRENSFSSKVSLKTK